MSDSKNKTLAEKVVLPVIEYMADNAYVAPGFHRLLNAAGLSTGLYLGRSTMDVVTARRTDGSEMKPSEAPVFLRPLYGKMRYNPYSDDPSDRWKFVADKLAPAIPGALGAFAGSYVFAHGVDLHNKPFHGPTATVKARMGAGEYSLQITDSRMRSHQADRIRPAAAAAYTFGGTSGFQVPGAWFPFSNSWSAVVFQVFHERIPTWPGMTYLNRVIFGNRSAGISDSIRPAMVKAARFVESNLMRAGNLDWLTPQMLDDMTQNALQSFHEKDITPQMRDSLRANLQTHFEEAHRVMLAHRHEPVQKQHQAVYEHLIGHQVKPGTHEKGGLVGYAFDNLLHRSGIPLEKAEIGGFTPFSFLGRLFGSQRAEREVERNWAKHLTSHYGISYPESRIPLDSQTRSAAWGTGALFAGEMGSAIAYTHYQQNHRLRETARKKHPSPTGTDAVTAPQKSGDAPSASDTPSDFPSSTANKPPSDTHGFKHWLNGKPLDAMEWVGRVAITPPSMHRLMCASSLSLSLIGGSYLANTLAGRELKGLFSGNATQSLIQKEAIWEPLRPLHGLLHYTPASITPGDRVRQAAHFLIPVVIGGYGTLQGSKLFFHSRTESLRTPETLEDYADKISLVQSRPFGALTAFTAIFNTGSGLHLLPFFNYSSNMQNRYLMASGQQVAMPGLGRWWSGNAGLFPWGVKGTLNYLVNYLTHNPDERPREVPALVEAIIWKLYPDLPPETMKQHKQAMIDAIYAVRDPVFDGDQKITKPEERQLKRSMQKLLRGEGFERLLLQSGLDPQKANLAANGASGKIANSLGARKEVQSLQEEFRHRYHERHPEEIVPVKPETPDADTPLPHLLPQSRMASPLITPHALHMGAAPR